MIYDWYGCLFVRTLKTSATPRFATVLRVAKLSFKDEM